MVNFQSTDSQLMAKGDADTKDESEETVPNPFSQLTDQELEEYKKEVERKKLELEGKESGASGYSRWRGGESLGKLREGAEQRAALEPRPLLLSPPSHKAPAQFSLWFRF